MTAAASSPTEGPLEAYRALVQGLGGVDEWYDDDRVRPGQDLVTSAVGSIGLPGLLEARAESRRLVEDDGIRYGGLTDEVDRGRSWVIDPLPVVIGTEEWAALERGLHQRAELLQLVLDDLYGDRLLLRDRVIPAPVVLGHPDFVRAADGIAGQRLVVGATDLARDAGGRWTVMADKTAAPSGAGYAMANRRVTSRVLAEVHRDASLARLRGWFHTMAAALGSAARVDVDMPRVVLLSPGAGSETAYDQGFLATLLGFPLVEADDLSVRGGRLWIRSSARREEVDVVLRRVDADYCDPLELRSDSQLGIAGLVEATRRGAVRMANPLGAGVLENAGLVAFLPEVAHRLLGEDLLLPSATTWWCGDSPARSHVLANLDRLVVKPIARGPVLSARFGWELDAAGRDDLRREVEARPWAWVGQEPVPMSTAPVVTPGGLAPGRLVLRTFGVTDSEHHHVMPGGLARVNTDASSSLVSSMSGAIAKDVWVLSDDTAGVGGWRGAPPEVQPTLVRLQRRVAVAPRVADNLYWVGRYAERAEGTARLLRVADDLAADHAQRPGTPGAATMEVMVQAAAAVTGVQPVEGQGPVDHLRSMVGDVTRTGTVAHACHRLVAGRRERARPAVPGHLAHPQPAGPHPRAGPVPAGAAAPPARQRARVAAGRRRRRPREHGPRPDVGLPRRRHPRRAGPADAGPAAARRSPPSVRRSSTDRSPRRCCEASESIITHRRRTTSGEGPAWPLHSATSLLLLDGGNPRSVAFQVARLGEALRLAGDARPAWTAATRWPPC